MPDSTNKAHDGRLTVWLVTRAVGQRDDAERQSERWNKEDHCTVIVKLVGAKAGTVASAVFDGADSTPLTVAVTS